MTQRISLTMLIGAVARLSPEMMMSIELVTWRDAHFDVEMRHATREDYLVKTVGWTTEGEKFLRIVSEKCPDGKKAVTYVPNENIIERRKLS